ncbi:MAG TPA: arsenate reductase ArsC [Solirubrobacterales bacterium]
MRYVLFVCSHNAGRSQMAQAFLERYAPEDIRAESAGDQPAQEIWPEVVQVMKEVGIDLSGRRPRKLLPEMQLHADWAVTLACGANCPYVPTVVEDWEVDDPAGKPLDEVRVIRDQVEARVKQLIADRLDEIRSDDTAHQMRLRRLLPSLVEEFGAERTPEEIRACTDAILAEYADVPVRGFVAPIVTRRARECLAAETCEPLAVA